MTKKKTLCLIINKRTLLKLLITMKLTLIFILAGVFQLSATLYSQNGLFTINMENTSMREVFKEIEKQSNLRFFYNDLLTDVDRDISLTADNLKIDELLDRLFDGSEITYKMMENNLVLVSPKALLQQVIVKGTVKSSAGEPLPGVNVIIKGTAVGVVTDLNGHYEIAVPSSNAMLVYSFIGYVSEEIEVGSQTEINVNLVESIESLEEVVVIGYGTQRRADVTSAVASVKSEDFLAGNIQDAAELVKGKIAGLTITKGSGDPNEESTIRLRGIISLEGENKPLVLVDGIEGSLGTVAPENIESIDVLKDASAAAIYGTRGANGVIIITTHSGRRKEETRVTYSAYGTMSGYYKVADFMGPRDVRFAKTAFKDRGWDTDWLTAVSQPGLTQNHSLGITGGTEKSSYSANVTYRNERGTIKKSNNKELRMQLDLSNWMINDKLKLNFNLLKGTHSNNLTEAGETGVSNIYRQAVIRNPTEPVYIDGDQSLGYYEDFTVFQYYNPVAMIYENIGEYKSEWTRLTGNITFEPLKGWQTNLKLSTFLQNRNTERYTTKDYFTATTTGNNGYAYKRNDYLESNQLELTSRYDHTFAGMHRFSAMAGYSYLYDLTEKMAASNHNYPTDAYLYNNLFGGAALKDGEAGMGFGGDDDYEKEDSKLISFFGRITYSFKDKYNLLATVRYEGSSRFGINHKWGTFPAVSAGWTVSNEDFMKNLNWIDNLKLRAGYGVTGVIAADPYRSITRWNYNTSSWGFYLNKDGEWKPSLEVLNNPNPDLKWETSGELNIGLDFSFLNDRISGSVDFYNKKTRDLLYWYNVPLPPNLKNETYANVGKIQNKGIEVMIQGTPVKTASLHYTATVTASHNAQKLVSMSNDLYETENYFNTGYASDPVSLPTQRLEVGSSFGRYWTLKTEGLSENGLWMVENPATGLYEEWNAGMSNDDYRQWMGSAIPKIYLGWDNYLRWKNIDLKIMMSSQLGFTIVNEQRIFYENNSIAYNRLESAADLLPIIDENGQPTGESRLLSTAQSQTIVSWYFEKGDFLKIDYVTLGYRFNTPKMKFVENFRVYASGENLFCLTSYAGLDPELSNDNIWALGIDGRDKYPTIRSFTVGATITFK
jgi:TonB-linked SusC/RagA family outer membrane protein